MCITAPELWPLSCSDTDWWTETERYFGTDSIWGHNLKT